MEKNLRMYLTWQCIHCTSRRIVVASEVPTELLAVQLYDPELPLCILGMVYFDPL